MKILSDPREDVRHWPKPSGGYEWWYFDGISYDGKYSFVVIFYEGNPFSTRYNRLLADGKKPSPSEFPAVSISIYEEGDPIYYSFTEFEKKHAFFDKNRPLVNIGSHKLKGSFGDDQLKYELNLEEELPSGDGIEATFEFQNPSPEADLFKGDHPDNGDHEWNLVQPRAEVRAEIRITARQEEPRHFSFEGNGYHDHNTGKEPLRDEFRDWYWGRFHFDYGTLVYYTMNCPEAYQYRAWLFEKDNGALIQCFDQIDFSDKGLSLFGLKPARKIGFRSPGMEIQVQQSRLLDNGPFYQRYQGDAFLQIPGKDIVESTAGISEYIRPDRIHSRIFWPLLNMRIRNKAEAPHWVQRSKILYRWTW